MIIVLLQMLRLLFCSDPGLCDVEMMSLLVCVCVVTSVKKKQ